MKSATLTRLQCRRLSSSLARATIVGLVIGLATIPSGALASQLWVAAATTSITPDKPVAVDGQFATRIARTIDNPITATAVALETRDGDRVLDQAVMVSCDLVGIRNGIQKSLRESLRDRVPGLDLQKIFLTATHTHTAPVTQEGIYDIPKDGVLQPSQYVDFLVNKLADLIADTWKRRQPGGVSWGIGHAVVGHNRRAVYADGSAVMYGKTDRPDFRRLESGEDHTLELLFFWDQNKKPLAVAVNVACPSQEVEGRSTVNADFWNDVRDDLHARVSKDLCVLGWPSAAGDQSPHLLYRKAAELRMQQLRGLSSTQEIARRISREVVDVLDVTRQDIRTDISLLHKVEQWTLPRRKITQKDADKAQATIDELKKDKAASAATIRAQLWHQRVIDRFRQQDQEPPFTMELHALRLGDIAIVTNPFELFVDYGIQIKARSKALQTFVLQLTCETGHYLATQRAVDGGGYSAIPQSTEIGPEGGQQLVDRSLTLLNSLW